MGIRARGLGGLARVLSDRALTQRHTGDRHHFEADLRSNPGRTCWSWRAICGMCGKPVGRSVTHWRGCARCHVTASNVPIGATPSVPVAA